jgi:hypothetical protein
MPGKRGSSTDCSGQSEGDIPASEADHKHHLGHMHCHGPGCGHEAVQHDSHVDYIHQGHRHTLHGQHYDEH